MLLSRQNDRTVALQLIQTISILSHNINTKASRRTAYTVYFHSNNFLNDVIAFPFDFSDEEIAENFMSWLKGLATNLSLDTLQYYFTRNSCPLLLQAQRFYNYPEPMTKTAARTVALCLFKTKHPEVIRITVENGFFVHLMCFIRKQWEDIDQLVASATGDNLGKLQMALEEQTDNVYYLNDLSDIGHPGLTNTLGDVMLKYLLLPMVAGSLGTSLDGRSPITIQLAEFMFVQLVSNLKNKQVVNGLIAAVFLKEVSPLLSSLCLGEVPPPPVNFSFRYRQDAFTVTKGGSKETAPLTALQEVNKLVECAQGLDDLSEKVPNAIRSEFFGFLRSKDDNLIVLTCLSLYALLTSVDVHRCLLHAAGLLPQSQVKTQLLFEALLDEREEPKDMGRPMYSPEVMEQLIGLLAMDPPFRLSTTRLVCQLVATLAESTTSEQSLSPEHLRTLSKALSSAIVRVHTIMNKSFYNDLFVDLFEEEMEAVSKIDFTAKIPCQVSYLVPMFDDSYSALPLGDRLPYGEIEIARRDIHVFFLLLKLKLVLVSSSSFEDYTGMSSVHTLLEVHKTYEMDDREFTRCVIKEGKEQLFRYFAEDPHYFILVTPTDKQPQGATVTHITSLRSVEAMVDRSDPRALVLALKQGRDSVQLILGFDSATLCHKVKKTIDDYRKRAKERSLEAAEGLLQTLERQLGA